MRDFFFRFVFLSCVFFVFFSCFFRVRRRVFGGTEGIVCEECTKLLCSGFALSSAFSTRNSPCDCCALLLLLLLLLQDGSVVDLLLW